MQILEELKLTEIEATRMGQQANIDSFKLHGDFKRSGKVKVLPIRGDQNSDIAKTQKHFGSNENKTRLGS